MTHESAHSAPGPGHGGFLRHLLHAAPVIAVVSVLVFLLGHAGLLRVFETAALDTWLRLKTPLPVRDVVIVGITDCDYEELFAATSPLDPSQVARVLDAVRAGQPRAIGVDLDTAHAMFAGLARSSGGPPVVWARGVTPAGSRSASCKPLVAGPAAETHADHGAAALDAHDHELLEPAGVLGATSTPAGALAGIALLPQDADGLVRRYRRVFRTTHGTADSLPWALVRLASPSRASDGAPDQQLVLNFAGDRLDFPRYSAQAVLAGAQGEAWGEQGPLRGKIVLLGGFYRAARDEYLTPVGPMAGVELVAQAVESDLAGRGIRATNEAIMIALEILGGVLMVWLYFRLGLGRALMLSLAGIPLAALCFSYLSFSTVGRWASFIPTMVAVLLHQLHHHATEYRRLYLESVSVRPAPLAASGAEIASAALPVIAGESPTSDASAGGGPSAPRSATPGDEPEP